MSGLRQFAALEEVALPAGAVHLAIGVFDGVHRGHQAVIRAAVEAARREGGSAGVLTFRPHPAAVLRPEQPVPLLLSPDVKRHLLAGLGIDFLVEHPFTPAFAATPARSFVAQLAGALPGLRAVYVGENFRFGQDRAGDVAVLRAEAADRGFTVVGIARLHAGGEPVSSSRLRRLIADGAVAEANALLGYPYRTDGRVEPGRRLGRQLGFPTLNIAWSPDLRPRHGVYAVTISGPSGRAQPAVANYGLRPTVEAGAVEPRLEVHALEPTELGYGDEVTVRWHGFLRPERRFSGLEELRTQVEKDCAEARAALAKISLPDSPKSA